MHTQTAGDCGGCCWLQTETRDLWCWQRHTWTIWKPTEASTIDSTEHNIWTGSHVCVALRGLEHNAPSHKLNISAAISKETMHTTDSIVCAARNLKHNLESRPRLHRNSSAWMWEILSVKAHISQFPVSGDVFFDRVCDWSLVRMTSEASTLFLFPSEFLVAMLLLLFMPLLPLFCCICPCCYHETHVDLLLPLLQLLLP